MSIPHHRKYNLRDKVAIVAGGSRGIGRAVSEGLGREGAAIVVNYVSNHEAANDTVRAIAEGEGKALAVKADMSRVEDIRRLFDEAETAFGEIDIVVANAATAVIKPFVEFSEDEYDQVFNVNAKGVFFILQEAAKRLRNGGRIIVTSTGGVRMLIPGNALYLASKGTIEQLVRTVAQELGPRNITVNAILPGYTKTDLLPERDRRVAAEASPFKRVGEPEDVADVALFLASNEARWITGQEIGAGGGVF
ncbi:SDR family oxidoreductase [Mesorhizobium sp. B2-4-6]|uniref:SDR family oxidoreductase n=1 Tax=Mesorhizobium sp. B2-4-6 TaxID=2589943 RepID=UPI001127FA90|nr:SDR family oxidoreductase [Mesorhizobium sp. B2-4-6]TPL46448.1 SDR family oxidoreductase [Mesorhizobium sp. B2-4-6]